MSTTKLTDKKLQIIIDKYKPNKFIKFVFNTFGNNNDPNYKSDLINNNLIKNTTTVGLLTLFLIGFFGVIFNLPTQLIIWITLTYTTILTTFAILIITATILNNIRIKKICKQLGITPYQYNLIITKLINNNDQNYYNSNP